MPFELALFVAGMLGWRFARYLETKMGKAAAPGWIGYLGICAIVITFGHYFPWVSWMIGGRIGGSNAQILLILMAMPLIALGFHFTRHDAFDRVVGELSYPVYLNHLFFIVALRECPIIHKSNVSFGLMAASLSCVSAWIFWKYYLKRFEDKRHKHFGLDQSSIAR